MDGIDQLAQPAHVEYSSQFSISVDFSLLQNKSYQYSPHISCRISHKFKVSLYNLRNAFSLSHKTTMTEQPDETGWGVVFSEENSTRFSRLEKMVIALDQRDREKEQQIKEINTTLTTKDQEIVVLRHEIGELQASVHTLQVQNDLKDQQISELKTQLVNLQGENVAKDKEVTELTERVSILQSAVQQLEGDNNAKDDRITKITAQVDILQGKLDALQKEIVAKDKEILLFRTQVVELREVISTLKKENGVKDEQIKNLEAEMKKKDDAMSTVATNLNTMIDDVKHNRVEINTLSATVQEQARVLREKDEAMRVKDAAIDQGNILTRTWAKIGVAATTTLTALGGFTILNAIGHWFSWSAAAAVSTAPAILLGMGIGGTVLFVGLGALLVGAGVYGVVKAAQILSA